MSNPKARKRKLSGFCDFYIVSKAGFLVRYALFTKPDQNSTGGT